MIDTIAIVLPKSDFKITDFDFFTPDCQFLMEAKYMKLGRTGVAKCFQNATKKEIKSGFYKPRLTLSRFVTKNHFDPSDDTAQEIRLHIEFSAPKLVMGQNLGELSNGDFCHVVAILIKTLEEMGVVTDFDSITQAWVHKIHYGKNIIFNDGTPIKFILKSIERADIPRRLDAGKTDYRNEGSIIRYHTNTYELSFYDKLKDLQAGRRSDKRALEDDNGIQAHWLDTLKAEGISILRMEVRLNSKKTIQKFLEKAGIIVTDKKVAKWILKIFQKRSRVVDEKAIQLRFEDLFDANISKAVCLYFWQFIEDNIVSVVLNNNEIQENYYKLLEAGIKKNKALELVGTLAVTDGMREIRGVVSAKNAKDIKFLSSAISSNENYTYVIFCAIKQALNLFEPVRIDDYVC